MAPADPLTQQRRNRFLGPVREAERSARVVRLQRSCCSYRYDNVEMLGVKSRWKQGRKRICCKEMRSGRLCCVGDAESALALSQLARAIAIADGYAGADVCD